MSETLSLRGTLRGHGDWVTSIATTPEDPNLVLSSSRDKSVLVWTLTHSAGGAALGEGDALPVFPCFLFLASTGI